MTGGNNTLLHRALVIATAEVALRCAAAAILLLLCCTQAYAFDDDHNAAINGTSLHFRVRGTNRANPYLLILHGGPGFSAHMFYSWGASLESKLNVVYLDQRGCGQSKHLVFANAASPTDAEVKGYTIDNLVKDIEGVRSYLNVEKWYVLGHSWGAMLGVEYAAAYPEHIAGFVILDGLISQPRTQDSILDFFQTRYAKQRESTDPKRKSEASNSLTAIIVIRQMPLGSVRMTNIFAMAGQNYAETFFARAGSASSLEDAIKSACKQYSVLPDNIMTFEPGAALQITERYASKDDTKLLGKVTAPTLIINGRQDAVVTPSSAQITNSGIKGSQLVLVDDCGHYPFIEQPARATAAIINFVNEQPR